jgi:hypothetical protein
MQDKNILIISDRMKEKISEGWNGLFNIAVARKV